MPRVYVNPRKELVKILATIPGINENSIFIGSVPQGTRLQRVYHILRSVGERYKTDYYEYMWQRIDIYTYADTSEAADEIDFAIYEVLEAIQGGFPIVQCLPGGNYDAARRVDNPNQLASGVFRSYRVMYADSYQA